jgi:cation diffusion facilitator family transporter
MTDLLARLFVRDHKNTGDPAVRLRYGTMVSIVCILCNVFLSAFKFVAGLLLGSIAITADALNNLSDAASQVITLITFKIAAKPADRDHPFGHARMEYIASMVVSFLILLVGVELFRESLRGIFHPTDTVYGTAALVILALSVLAKLWLFFFNRRLSKTIDSTVMKATATDSLSDAGATAAVLVSALVSRFLDVRTDAYMGIAVSVLIVVAGIRILSETKNSLLGSAPDPEVLTAIDRICKEYPELLGVHDMVVHNYGSGNTIASLHAEVDGSADVYVIHDAIDNIERRLYSEMGVRATIHMDPIVTNDEKVLELKALVTEAVKRVDSRLSIHDFRFVEGITHSNLIFDITAPFEVKLSDREVIDAVDANVKEIDKSFCTVITVDRQ